MSVILRVLGGLFESYLSVRGELFESYLRGLGESFESSGGFFEFLWTYLSVV